VAIVVAVSAQKDNRNEAVLTSTRWSAVCLIVSVVASMVTIIALTRGYERARSRHGEKTRDFAQGQLKKLEPLFILIPAYSP